MGGGFPFNLCNVPAWVLGSLPFSRHPRAIEAQGVRDAHRFLFERLGRCESWEQRAALFRDYMDVAFHLHQWKAESTPSGRVSLKNSYLRFLRGWMVDANSVEGAVLKGWAESRLGLPPTCHRAPIRAPDSEEYLRYLKDRMDGSARTNCILGQLDVLYEFVQEEVRRRHGTATHLTLYRGMDDWGEPEALRPLGPNRFAVRLNNLNSFTRDFERAWEFGTRVLKASVPLCKVFFDGSFLHSSILRGEEEVIVMGGEYDLRLRLY